MPRKPRRDAWRQVNGKWMRSLGNRGARVRLFESTKGGMFYRDVWINGRKDRKCLHTRDRAAAERLGTELLAALLRNEHVESSGAVTLGRLWEKYRTECPAFLDNESRTQREEAVHVQVLLGFFGEDCDVRHMTGADVQAFTAARLRGGIAYTVQRNGISSTAVTEPVRARSPEVELRILRTMLRWATTVRVRGGQRLLASDPLAGVRSVKEKNPKRPVATWERYQATRAAMQQLAISDAAKYQHWLRMELALVLAEATGRRLGAIRQLRWEDFDLVANVIHWRAENDKRRKAWSVPIPPDLLGEIRRFRIRLGGIFGGVVFPSRSNPQRPLDRYAFRNALIAAETRAGLSKLDGSSWHAYRRAWASVRKHLSLVDVASAGGWLDTQTLLTCYQVADPRTMLAVMSEPTKLTERVAGT